MQMLRSAFEGSQVEIAWVYSDTDSAVASGSFRECEISKGADQG